jgi:hypothetical protein
VDTNVPRKTATNPEGYFTMTDLPPGSYVLTAEKLGFQTYRQTGIVLEVGQMFRSDVQMLVGSVQETVSVTAAVAPLNTENGAIKGDVIVQREIQDLPLDGRDFTDLAFLVPGVLPNSPGGAGSTMAINGARGDNSSYYVDGFNDRNERGDYPQLRPNIDAIQEFKMEVGGFSAEYGKMAGGIMNMVLRSGGNQFHGTVFEYLRNDVFDARSFFDTAVPELRQNQFGGTVTGPVVLPRIYNGHDRTFFLFSMESFRQIQGSSQLGNLPTLLERAGDFSQSLTNLGAHISVTDPFNKNAPFPNDVIPAAEMNPIALKLLQYYPPPNRINPNNNYLSTANAMSDWDSFVAKIDHRLPNSDSLSFRCGKRFNRSTSPFSYTKLGEDFGDYIRDDRALAGLDYTHLFTPTLILEARMGVSRSAQREHTLRAGQNIAQQLGIAGSTTDPLLIGWPLITLTNYIALGSNPSEPVQYYLTDIQEGAKFTWSKGNHTLKWGADITQSQYNQPYYNNSRGTIGFTTAWTGSSMGDLLLGLPNGSSINAQPNHNYLRFSTYGMFINDDIKVTRSLTVNLGLRYEIDQPPAEKYDRMSNFIPSIGKIIVSSDAAIPNFAQLIAQAKLTNLVGLAGDYGLPQSLVYT